MSSNKFGNEPPVLGARPLQQLLDPPRVADSSASHFIVTGPGSSNTVSPSALSPSKPVVEDRDFLEIDPELLRDFLTSSAQSDLPPVVADARINDAGINAEKQLPNLQAESIKRSSRWLLALRFPFYLAARALDLFSLLVLIAVVAAIPLLQFISLGYLLVAGSRLADRRPWRQCLPGLRLAGRVGLFALLTGLLSLPVLIVADLAHSAQLLEPNSGTSARWRIGAFLLTAAWLVHVGWAAMRGGRWWHFLWPAPLQFLKQIWRPSTWQKASDQLYDFVAGLQLPKLWWMGAQATVGALLWLVIPVSMMIIGQRAQAPVAPLIGLVGAIVMAWVMFYLPFFQLIYAQTGSMKSFLAIKQVRMNYSYAPWAHTLSLVLLSTLAIPLYLLRIEATPSELAWLPSLFFALLMLPTKLILGWAIGYSNGRQAGLLSRRAWWSRIPAKMVGFSAVAFYVGALYVAQLIAAQGAYVMYFQHAFLVPNPLFFGN